MSGSVSGTADKANEGEAFACVKLHLDGVGTISRRGRKGKKQVEHGEGSGGGYTIDKFGRRHHRGEAWHLARQQAEQGRAAAAAARPMASTQPRTSTRARHDAASLSLALRAAQADSVLNFVGQEEKRRRFKTQQKDTDTENEVKMMRKKLEKHEQTMAGLRNHNERLRERESEALDAIKAAELESKERVRAAEELRLQLVAAEAARDARVQQADEAHARMLQAQEVAQLAAAIERAHVRKVG